MKNISLLLLSFFFCFTSQAQKENGLIQKSLQDNQKKYSLTKDDVSNWKIVDSHTSKKEGISFYYVYQTFDDLILYNALSIFVIKKDGITMTSNQFIPNLKNKIETKSAVLSPQDAIHKAAEKLGLETSFQIKQLSHTSTNKYTFSAEKLSAEKIHSQLKLFPLENNKIRAVWDLDIYQKDQKHWWSLRVDAQTGEILDQTDWVINCQIRPSHNHTNQQPFIRNSSNLPLPALGEGYNVFAIPTESPNHGPRQLLTNPYDGNASPFGWQDINGSAGAEFTTAQGNNVYASEDQSGNNNFGYTPDGGASLDFNFPLDLNQNPTNYEDASITNLFYMNNIMHDVWYQYGFDESSGNFQKNNYGNGGYGADHVDAEGQDGGGMNNANFATPPDGSRPRMQMYLWTAPDPFLMNVNSPTSIGGPYQAIEAGFGVTVPTSPITSDVVIYDDNTGDEMDACETPVNGSELDGKIVLVKRGTCNFTDKVVNAENEGAIAVIVVNNVAGAPIVMGGTDPGIGIPSVMISQIDGNSIIAKIENSETVNISLENPGGTYQLDGSLDNTIVSHEYGHGISTRLAGGAGNSNCLTNDEQMGEGWSDWFALMLTIEAGDIGEDARGMGTYASGETPTGNGIRLAPYSTDFAINDFTYATTNNSGVSQPHGIGFIWSTMLWDLTWALIDKYGFDPDVYNGTGGNNVAMNLVITALKLQSCSPGFVDGRDAILQADQVINNGENECLIWAVFANRGLGYSADQGSSTSRSDQSEAFDLPPGFNANSGSESISTCGNYTWSANGQTYNTTGTYTSHLYNVYGCDSIATLNLTIDPVEDSTRIISRCGSYTWPANGQTYNTTGTYSETYTTSNGCDSTYTLNLTITTPTSSTKNVATCGSYTWSANGQTYNTTGTHTETLTTSSGCDSTVTLNLIIDTYVSGIDVESACDSYVWIDGNTYTSNNNTATYTIPNGSVNNCDSIVTLNLTIGGEITHTENISTCGSYTWAANGQTYTNSGSYTETLTTVGGCDSTVTLYLTIQNGYSNTETKSVCNSYYWATNGQTYTNSGTYSEVLTATNGCDSTQTLFLTVESINPQVAQNNGDLIATSDYNTYQWVDCNKGYSPIQGAYSSTYTPQENGSYAVIVNTNFCADTSDCVMVSEASLTEGTDISGINIYPNPTNGRFIINTNHNTSIHEVSIYDMTGKKIQQKQFQTKEKVTWEIKGEKGVYIIEVTNDSNDVIHKKITKL